MKTKFWRKVAIGVLTMSLVGTGVYAGTVISTYKTARGDYATVEKEEVHKNRVALNVDGKKMNTKSWYANGVTYVPMREAAEMLGAEVNYDSKTQTAEITSKPAHPPLDIIKKSDLPYTIKTPYNFSISINSIYADGNGITFNVTATNYNKNYSSSMDPYNWKVYANNKQIGYSKADDFLTNHSDIAYGETVTGDIFFNGLPEQTKVLTVDFRFWTNASSYYLVRFEI